MQTQAFQAGTKDIRRVSDGQARWALALLTAAMGVNQLDRGLVAILLQSIKTEMVLSDAALGLMTGLGFSVVYALASFPVGRWADRYNRTRIISLGVVFYSAAAACMGLATNVMQLIAFRSVVAVGEATGSAPSSSVIADLFPRATRARAMGVWSAGTYIGLFIGLSMGGWINQRYGWRTALWATATPGVLLAALIQFTMREPPRQASLEHPVSPASNALGATLRELFSQPAYRALLLAIMFSTFVNYSFSAWIPSLLGRVHHLDSATIGLVAGTLKGLLGLGGALAGGFAAHYIAKGRLPGMGLVAACVSLLIVPCMLVFILADSTVVSLIGLSLGSFLIPACQAPGFTMIQGIARSEQRAFAMTLMFTSSSLFGLGLGPLAVGALSDHFQPTWGADSLGVALLLPTAASLVAAVFYARAASLSRRIGPDARPVRG